MKKEDVKEVVEEVPTEEKEENIEEKPVKTEEKVEEPTVYPHKALAAIEERRQAFWKRTRSHYALKLVIMVLCFVLIIAAWIITAKVVPAGDEYKALKTGLPLGVAIASLLGSYLFATFMRRKDGSLMREFFGFYFESVNEYVFGDKNYSEVALQNPGKINLEEFNETGLYKDVIETGSRGLTTFKYKDLDLSIVDCAGNVKAEKRMKPVFVGKMVRCTAKYKGDTPIIVYFKGNERSLPPTNLEGIHCVLETEQMNVYTENQDWKKVLNGPVMKALEAIKVNDLLVDVAISIKEEKLFVMMGYDDPLMVLPYATEFKSKPTEAYKKDMVKICNLIEALN